MGRTSVKSILCSALLFCLAFVSPLLADDVITNVMSPIVSYQYPDDFSSQALTNGGIISPIISYQYFEWPGDDVLELLSSLLVSYFYQIGSEPLPLVLHGRVTDTVGVGISGAAISATVGLTPAAQTTTDASGNYALPPLGAGVYALKASLANYATSARALTLSASTAHQDFQLTPLPPAPSTTQVNRESTVTYTTGPMGSTLKVFDGTQFVPITLANAPSPSRMTIVLTHGFDSSPDVWASNMAAEMRAENVAASVANIVCWDWHDAAKGPLFPNLPVADGRTASQGIALGTNLLWRLGPTYSQPIHFIGHSLGTLVNAAAANYLHGDRTATERQEISPTPWLPSRAHMTLLDAAETASLVAFDLNPAGWNSAMPIKWKWADNYYSQWGLYQPDAVNAELSKPSTLAAVDGHSYAWYWYNLTVADPANCTLGFQRSYEARLANLSVFGFPPSGTVFPRGVLYYQADSASDPLALQVVPFTTLRRIGGTATRFGVQAAAGWVQFSNGVEAHIVDGEQTAGEWLYNGYEYVANLAEQGKQAVVNLFDSAMLRLRLRTTPPSSQNLMAKHGGPQPQGAGGASDSPPMAWLPIQFPSNATAMAFDFTVEGNPMDDVLVCGVGTNNLFSLEAKYIPTNTMSASRLIDVSAWAGTTNELFFGFMGGTSTNATLQIENIRFYSVATPRLEIARNGGTTLLSWPSMAGGYVVETTPTLVSPAWESISNAPAISADRYVLTNSWNEPSRFFRLRAR